MSPTGDYLATTHVGELGVFLWANKLLYERVFLKPIDRNDVDIPQLSKYLIISYYYNRLISDTVTVICPFTELPNTAPEKPDIEDLGAIDLGEEPEYKSPEQISKELITLSDQPTSRWLNLLHLDIVKRRNKPRTPLTVPKSAPFFLPTIPSLELAFDLEKEKEKGESKLLIPESLITLTAFGKKLVSSEDDEDYEKCIQYIKTLPPSLIEAEVTSMSPDGGGTIQLLKQFLTMLGVLLKTNRDFELAQSYLSLFLKTHTKVIAQNEELRTVLESVEETATQAWSKLQSNMLYNICVIKALKDM